MTNKQLALREAVVHRLPRKAGAVSATVHAVSECKVCGTPTTARLRINVVVGAVSVRMCMKCQKKLKTGASTAAKVLKHLTEQFE